MTAAYIRVLRWASLEIADARIEGAMAAAPATRRRWRDGDDGRGGVVGLPVGVYVCLYWFRFETYVVCALHDDLTNVRKCR